jgi:DNA-binding CsgD family transcriptional regulator/catechol 2,3-dioxygenase-like lactoylglutathione lyase family enzyme
MTAGGKRGRPPFEDVLTPAEWRIVEAVRHGLTGRQIAAARGISPDAVKYHVANALQKLGLADRRALRHWTGVARSSALAEKEPRMSEPGKPDAADPDGATSDGASIGAIAQIARTVGDIDAARAWYEGVLGLSHLYSFPGMAFFDCGGVRLYLSQSLSQTPAGAGSSASGESILYFRVGDIRAAHARLSQRGAVFRGAPHMIHRHPDGTEEWLAILEDNEGRPLAISAQVRPGPSPAPQSTSAQSHGRQSPRPSTG